MTWVKILYNRISLRADRGFERVGILLPVVVVGGRLQLGDLMDRMGGSRLVESIEHCLDGN